MNPLLRVFGSVNSLPHGYQIAGVAVAGGAVFMAAYGLAVAGLLELAASALVFFLMNFVSLLGPNLSRRAPKEFAKSASMLDQLICDFGEWRRNQRVLAQALLALSATIVFLLGRFVCATILPLITSVWFAGAIGLGLTAVVISPVLARGVMSTLNRSPRGTNGDEDG